ncbi:hypothetical protein GOP47_0009217 [Adiantum capillus-veneris]|uniref:Protein kinase domain-containing protein n=1 Tax=Adiantum capillus-veneris TaxID=13818 RepID=A0A9D4UWB7_ADICA|nr:hypothetical protein GOP47_0009217 [Adiantum capillus-veneris]
MTGEENQEVQQNDNVLVVGLKLDNTGRELLTWTLAKFTRAGNHVIALHVAPSTSEADVLRSQLEATEQQSEGYFDSIIGVYESFCSIRKVNLQVKVSDGPSLRRALIEECRKSNAVKLILGHVSSKPHIGPSFSLAKYCSRRLPPTCSVMVIQQGQVTFEKEGSLRNLGDNTPGVLNSIHKTFRTHNWKNSGRYLTDGRRASLSSKSLETEMDDDEYGNAACPWPLPSRFLDSPVSVLHAYKHSSFQKRASGPLESPLSALSSPTESVTAQNRCDTNLPGLDDAQNNEDKVEHPHQSLEECFALTERYHDHGRSLRALEKMPSAPPIPVTSSHPHEEICTLHPSIDTPLNASFAQEGVVVEENSPSVGWPLLRKHVATDQEYKSMSRRLSVVEWALQLPDRPKEVVNHEAELLKWDTDDCNSSPQTSSERMSHEQQRTEDGTNVCETDAVLQSYTDVLGSRLSNMRACKQFELKELQDATDNFDSDNMVGRGGCSQVYQGVIAENHTVAVKCLNASAVDSGYALATEVEIMCSIHHNHIVQLLGYCLDNQQQMLVYNFAPQGNLEQQLHGGKGKAVLAWEPRYNIAVGVADALHYLHDCCEQPVIHRDVKSSNILLSADLKPQLTDFGLAKWMPASSTQLTCSDVVGTFGYLAPEYFMFGKVSEKTDVYSFGVVLLELITGRRPIDNTRPKGEENLVVWARKLLEDESSTEKLIDPKLEGSYDFGQLTNMMIAARLCLRQSSQMRPRMSRILKLLKGEVEDLEHIGRQDSVCKESDDGYDMPNYGEIDIRTHLTLALFGLDDDAASQASIEHSVNLAHSNKYLEEYLGGRYSRSSSFE